MRLRILSDEEMDALYGRPRFTQEERNEYFTLSPEEKAALEGLHSLKSKVVFILQLGYFKACSMFFVFGLKDVEEDATYVRDKYFPAFDDADPEIAEGTRLKQQRLILDLYKYRNADAVIRRTLEARARQTAAVCGKPVYVFRELMHYLAEQRIVAPGYSTMQDIIGGALANEQRRLAAIVDDHVDPFRKSSSGSPARKPAWAARHHPAEARPQGLQQSRNPARGRARRADAGAVRAVAEAAAAAAHLQ
jgi:hypothetical protein